mgnify:CR=1 FL=1
MLETGISSIGDNTSIGGSDAEYRVRQDQRAKNIEKDVKARLAAMTPEEKEVEFNRAEGVKDDATAAEKAAARAESNTTLAKFVTNVESRIFANLSKQMVDNMFGTNCTPSDPDVADDVECPDEGLATLPDGSTVHWIKDEDATDESGAPAPTITLTVTDALGTVTQLIVPVGDFKF